MKKNVLEQLNIWNRSSECYVPFCRNCSTLGERLKEWRNRSNITLKEFAEAILRIREDMGIAQPLQINYKSLKPTDFGSKLYDDARMKRITNISKNCSVWEKIDFPKNDCIISLNSLKVLKKLIRCDYEFLTCEINTLHRGTDYIAILTGLDTASAEKLITCYKELDLYDSDSVQNSYTYAVLQCLDQIISDKQLLTYLSYYMTYNHTESVENSIKIQTDRSNGDNPNNLNKEIIIDIESLKTVGKLTISNLLCKLQRNKKAQSKMPETNAIVNGTEIAYSDDSFGTRIKKWRLFSRLTQPKVAEKMAEYLINNNLYQRPETEDARISLQNNLLRSYQNWEAKKDSKQDIRMSLTDICMLKSIMGCDYEYLFGDINTLKRPSQNPLSCLGLSEKSIKQLESLASKEIELFVSNTRFDDTALASRILETIDQIVMDNNLLFYLTYFLTDLECSINIVLPDVAEGYGKVLYEDDQRRNLFLPLILDRISVLHTKII